MVPVPWLIVSLALSATLPAVYTLDPCLDVDTWWHMATGRWIIQNHDVPWIDPFSQLSHDTPTRWYAYSWLFEILLFETFREHSYTGIMLVRSILVALSTASVFTFLLWRSGSTLRTISLAVPLGIVLMMFAKERPWHFTIAFTTITLAIVQTLREHGCDWRAIGLVPLFVLWANLHIQFVLGWLILGLACLFPGVASRRAAIALTILCIGACAVNPYHARLLIVIAEYASQIAPREFVQELAPPAWNAPSTLATVFILTISIALAVRSRGLDGFSILLLAASIFLASTMRRDIWFAAVAAIAVLPRSQSVTGRQCLACATVIIMLILAVRLLNQLGVGPTTEFRQAQQRRYPPAELMSLTRHQACLNPFDWGGYIVWHCPTARVSIDGRTNLYGSEYLRQSFELWERSSNDVSFRIESPKIVIAPTGSALAGALRTSPEIWRLHFENSCVAIFLRYDFVRQAN